MKLSKKNKKLIKNHAKKNVYGFSGKEGVYYLNVGHVEEIVLLENKRFGFYIVEKDGNHKLVSCYTYDFWVNGEGQPNMGFSLRGDEVFVRLGDL